MSIKSLGGVFGRNPTFNDVTVEGDLSVDGTLTIGGSVITGLNLQGNWDAATNTPDLTVLTPPAGQFWIVSVAGSTNLGGITNWTVGDWALYDGTGWQRVEGGTVDLSNGVTGTLAITNGGTGASTASTARTNLGSGAVGDNLFTATTALAAQQAMDTEVGVDVQPYDATILKSADIGVTVEAYDSTILKSADIGVTVEAYDSTILKSADIGVTVQGYDSTILNAADIGVTVEAYDATILKSADIGSTVQGYDADTAKYDDTTANFTGTLQSGGNNVLTTASDYLDSSDIGSTVQGYDADTAKYDDATAAFTGNLSVASSVLYVDSSLGKCGIGTSSPQKKIDIRGNSGASTDNVTLRITCGDTSAILNQVTGRIENYTSDADGPHVASYIETISNEAYGRQSSLSFGVSQANNADATEAFRIDNTGDVTVSTGNLVIGTSGKGIDFSATSGTGTSELLDDYEEGTFTATLTPNTSGSITLGTYDTLAYTKVGRQVTITGQIGVSSVSSPVGTYFDLNLPFSIGTLTDLSGRSAGVTVEIGSSTLLPMRTVSGSVVRVYIDCSTITTNSFVVGFAYFTD